MSRDGFAVSVVLVHYHGPEQVAGAVASLHPQIASRRIASTEVLVVDNGSTADERSALEALPVRIIDPGSNTGYAGGLNRGVAEASGDVLVLANPDLELAPGALDRLVETALDVAGGAEGAAIVGPAFHWDRSGRLLLPPAERRDRWGDLLARLASRGPSWAARARRRWRRHARRHWNATAPLSSPWLSGALMVATRGAWERVGPLDAGYALYFEETDWLLRARRKGVAVLHEPRARVRHHYDGSASREPQAAEWFRRSEERFADRWYGSLHRVLRRLATPEKTHVAWPEPPLEGMDLDLQGLGVVGGDGVQGELWVELSPSPLGFPAAGERLSRGAVRWEVPVELRGRFAAGRWRVALVDGAGRERQVGAVGPR